jgi:outer membrane protein
MKASAVFLLLLPLCCAAETRTMTLRQALDLALQQNPDLVMARLDQQKARAQVIIAKDVFRPKVYAGSGAAWTYGFPTSIDGNAPSIVQAKTVMSIFDRPQTYQIAATNEALRGAGIDIASKQQEVAYQVASLYLDAENSARSAAAAQQEVGNLTRVKQLVDARVQEGRELPIASQEANLNILRAKQRAGALDLDETNAELSLALALGMAPDDRVRAAAEERPALQAPASEDATIRQALDTSPEVKRLESNLQAKLLEIKGYQAEKLPKIDLVAQYALLSKYNNYEQYFARFQRHNVELGASFQIPLLSGRAPSAQAMQAEADAAKLRVQIRNVRGRITADLRRAFQDVQRADTARDVARADLDLARQQTTLDLALMDEGRVLPAKVEADRATEQEKWLAYYDAQTTSERARLVLLRQAGTLTAALR